MNRSHLSFVGFVLVASSLLRSAPSQAGAPVDALYWHVDTFNAQNLDPTPNNHAMWCGVPAGTAGYTTAPGYGDQWDERLQWSGAVPDPSLGVQVRLRFDYNADLELGFDNLFVESYRAGSFVLLDTITDRQQGAQFDHTWTVQPAELFDDDGSLEIVLRLRVVSDLVHSDEDGFYPSDGAVQVDNLSIEFDGQPVSLADFEPAGSDGGWTIVSTYWDTDDDLRWSSEREVPSDPMADDWEVTDLEVYDGELIVCGDFFLQGGGLGPTWVRRWDGTSWVGLGEASAELYVPNDMEIYQGDLVVAAASARPDITNAARWDGTSWHSMDAPPLAQQLRAHDDLLFAVTSRDSVLGYVSKWDGSTWSPADPAIDFKFNTLHVHQGQLYAGGPSSLVFWYDGSSFVDMSGNLKGTVNALASYGGDLIAAGDLHTNDQVFDNYLVRWNGATWEQFGPLLSGASVQSLLVHDDDLYVSGSRVEGGPSNIMRWDGSTFHDMGTRIPPGVAVGTARSMVVLGDELFVGGDVSCVGSLRTNLIAGWSLALLPTSAPGPRALSLGVRLERSYPNPFNPRTTLRYSLPQPSRVRLSIYDLRGRRVRTVVDAHRDAGRHKTIWDGTDHHGGAVASGVYLATIRAGGAIDSRKITLVR